MLDFSTVPFRRWRGITFCNGNPKEKPAPSKSQTNPILFLE
jgi:hypothetical protein